MTFIYRGPLPPNSPLFRGRRAEMKQLLDLCRVPVRAYAIVYGGRQMGKTSLLLRLAEQLPPSIHTCRVDFQSIQDLVGFREYDELLSNYNRGSP